MSGGGKGGGTTVTTQKSDPWSGQQPYLSSGFGKAASLYGINAGGGSGTGGGGGFPGIAAANALSGTRGGGGMDIGQALLTGGLSARSNNSPGQDISQALNAGLPVSDASWAEFGYGPGGSAMGGQSGGGSIFTPPGGSGSSDPSGGPYGPQYFPGQTLADPSAAQTGGLAQIAKMGANGTDVGNAASNAVLQGIQGSPEMDASIAARVMPQIQGQFASGNRLDSGLASRAVGSGMTDAILQNQRDYIGMAPGMNAMQFGNAQAGEQAGERQTNLAQQGIQDQMSRWNYNQQLPFSNLNNYMSLIQGNYGSNSNTSNPYFQNTLANLGSAAGGLASLYSSGIFGSGAGAAAGAGAAELSPLELMTLGL